MIDLQSNATFMNKIILFALLLVFNFSNAQEMKQKIEEIIEEHHSSFPDVGLVVSISKDEQVLFKKAYGYANLPFRVAAETDHKFRIGSITKQFTSVAVLKLVEEGKLDLQDLVQKYLPGFPSEVTIEHLLTHTSGLLDYGNKADWFSKVSKQDLEPQDLADYVKNDSLHFSPGNQFEYNNTGYHLLGLIIEKLSGKTYADFLKEEIFVPLQMTNTFAHDSQKVVVDLVDGYELMNGQTFHPEYIHPKQPFSAGSLVSTAGDLQKWYSGLFAGKLIKPETLEKALTPFKLNDGSHSPYGYGWFLDEQQGLQVVNHGSNYPGYIAEVSYFPKSGILVTALSNSMPLTNLVKKLGLVANSKSVEKKQFLELSKEELLAFNATYGQANEKWNFMVFDGKVYYSVNNGTRYEVKPVKKNLFYSLDWDVFLEFKDPEAEAYKSFVLHWNGSETEYSLIND